MNIPIIPLALFLFVAFQIIRSLKICSESERLAVSRLGRMMPLRGPGLVIVIPTIEMTVKVKLGDTVQLLHQEMAEKLNVPFPIEVLSGAQTGSSVIVRSFVGTPDNCKAIVSRS